MLCAAVDGGGSLMVLEAETVLRRAFPGAGGEDDADVSGGGCGAAVPRRGEGTGTGPWTR